MSRRTLFQLSCLAALCCPVTLLADEPASTAEAKASAPMASTAEIAGLVKDLDADDFKVRQLAAEKLNALGKPAIPALSEAAQSSQLELMSQSLGILRSFYQGNNAELKAAAKEALEKVAAGNNPNAAQRAKDLLAPPKENGSDPNRGINIGGAGQGQIIINGAGGINGRIQINGGLPIQIGNGARVYSKSVSNANGVKTTKVKQDGVEIEIVEGKEEITVKKTENGKTEEFKAKDAEELKKKHPAGHELFEKHAGDKNAAGGVIGLQIGGNIQGLPNIQIGQAIPAQIMPAVPLQAAKPIPVNAAKIRAESQLHAVERMIESAELVLSQAANTDDVKDATKAVAEHLAKAKAELAKAKEKISGKAKDDDGAANDQVRKNIAELKKNLITEKFEADQAKAVKEAENASDKERAAKDAELAALKAKLEAEVKAKEDQVKQEVQKALDEVKKATDEATKDLKNAKE